MKKEQPEQAVAALKERGGETLRSKKGKDRYLKENT